MAKSRGLKIFLIVALIIPLFCCTGIIGSCGGRWPAKPTEMQKKIVDAQGKQHQMRIWQAERIVKLPFNEGRSVYVEIDGRKYKLHDGGSGYGIAGLYVSPDKNQVVIGRAFEGGETSGLLVDFRTMTVNEKDLLEPDPPLPGWSEVFWQTALEDLTRQQLHEQLACGDHPKVVAAIEELSARGFDASDWLAMAKVFADPKQPPRIRTMLGSDLVYQREEQDERWRRDAHYGSTTMPRAAEGSPDFDRGPVDLYWPEEIIQLVASALNDPDAEIRGTAVKALAVMVRDAPQRDRVRDVQHGADAYTETYQQWWKNRAPR